MSSAAEFKEVWLRASLNGGVCTVMLCVFVKYCGDQGEREQACADAALRSVSCAVTCGWWPQATGYTNVERLKRAVVSADEALLTSRQQATQRKTVRHTND